MLNEKRVKHMVKLALYEGRGGAEEIKVSSYYKKDYIGFNVLWSVLWMTLAYVIAAVIVGMAFLKAILDHFSSGLIVSLVLAFIAGYALLLITYIVFSKKYYKKKHARAYHRVKRFKEGLMILEDMYREENSNG